MLFCFFLIEVYEHVWMWELDYKESWVPKSWCFWTVVLEKTLESPLDYKEIQPVHPKGDQSWIFIWRTDAETETPVVWPPDSKNCLIWKDPDAGKDWRQEEKGMTEDEMVGWQHWLDGHVLEQAPGLGDGQGSLECCSPWGRKESDMTERLNWAECRHGSGRCGEWRWIKTQLGPLERSVQTAQKSRVLCLHWNVSDLAWRRGVKYGLQAFFPSEGRNKDSLTWQL